MWKMPSYRLEADFLQLAEIDDEIARDVDRGDAACQGLAGDNAINDRSRIARTDVRRGTLHGQKEHIVMAGNAKKTARRKSSTAVKKRGTKERLSEEGVRVRAYELYERREAFGIAGDPQSDWLEAERLLSIGED